MKNKDCSKQFTNRKRARSRTPQLQSSSSSESEKEAYQEPKKGYSLSDSENSGVDAVQKRYRTKKKKCRRNAAQKSESDLEVHTHEASKQKDGERRHLSTRKAQSKSVVDAEQSRDGRSTRHETDLRHHHHHRRHHPDEREGRSRNHHHSERSREHSGRTHHRRRDGGSSLHINRPIKQEPKSDNEAEYEWGKTSGAAGGDKKPAAAKEKEKPNFGLSGKLAEDTNTYKGVVIKYSEPVEARKPRRRWRFYPFKGEQVLPTLYLHRQSCYLIGRDRKVVDLPVDHPSCSKQHAALQYRLVPFERENGSTGKRVRPYLIDLESANGTYVNNVKIEPRKYVELIERDVIKFGFSSREYVLLHEQSKEEENDDDVGTQDGE